MTGLTLLKAVRNHPVRRNTAFVMITSQRSMERFKITQAAQMQVSSYIVKPFRLAHAQGEDLGGPRLGSAQPQGRLRMIRLWLWAVCLACSRSLFAETITQDFSNFDSDVETSAVWNSEEGFLGTPCK